MTRILNIPLQNSPGSLAEILEIMARAEINVDAIDCDTAGDFGSVRLLTNKPQLARELLEQDGYDVVEAQAIEIQVPNRYGELAKIAKKLADKRINVVSLFGTSPPLGGEGRIILRVNDEKAARTALGLDR
jgi:hypothetical protein